MTIEEIRKGAPSGAIGYVKYSNSILYFIKSNYGWRQIKGNIISFYESGISDADIQPLF